MAKDKTKNIKRTNGYVEHLQFIPEGQDPMDLGSKMIKVPILTWAGELLEWAENSETIPNVAFEYKHNGRVTFAVQMPEIQDLKKAASGLFEGKYIGKKVNILYGEALCHSKETPNKILGRLQAQRNLKDITLYLNKVTVEKGILQIECGGLEGTRDMMEKPVIVFSMRIKDPRGVRFRISKATEELMDKMYRYIGEY